MGVVKNPRRLLSKSTRLRPLEYRVLKQTDARPSRVLAMVSGGADSMAMLRILDSLRHRLQFELEILHVHHGPPPDREHELSGLPQASPQELWRDRASELVRKFAKSRELTFHLYNSKVKLESEAQFRRLRWEAIMLHWNAAMQEARPFDCVAFAHHNDDLLETRLIRLIRGTGAQGLTAMRPWSQLRGVRVWRPLLALSRLEVEDYLRDQGARAGQDWLEDPSNRDTRYLRNAIRTQLVPQIEAIRPGGVASLARSLELLAQTAEANESLAAKPRRQPPLATELLRSELMSLNGKARSARLAGWLKQQGVEDYSRAQIQEVLKRLDTDQRRFKFVACGRVWIVDEWVRLVAMSQQALELD